MGNTSYRFLWHLMKYFLPHFFKTIYEAEIDLKNHLPLQLLIDTHLENLCQYWTTSTTTILLLCKHSRRTCSTMLFINLTEPTLKHFSSTPRAVSTVHQAENTGFSIQFQGEEKPRSLLQVYATLAIIASEVDNYMPLFRTAFYPKIEVFQERCADRSIMEKKIETPRHLPYLSRP